MTERCFNNEVRDAVSPDTRKHLDTFAQSIAHTEGFLREYQATVPSAFAGQPAEPRAAVRQNARLVMTMAWAKAALFSRAIVDSVNDGNLLAAFQSLRAYVELVATVRYTVNQMEPLIREAVTSGQWSWDVASKLANHMQLLLHGGGFNWQRYFEEGAMGIIDRKRVKRTKEEKARYEKQTLRTGKCIKEWGEDSPAAEFIYDYLCDLVHPNKGSNLVILAEREQGPIFSVNETSKMGMIIFERIFPYAASMCMNAMTQFTPVLAALGADDDNDVG